MSQVTSTAQRRDGTSMWRDLEAATKRIAELEAALKQALGEIKEGFPNVAAQTIERALQSKE